MGLQTDIPGFRQSVRQSGGEGWIHHDIRHSRDTLTRWLAGQCFVGIPGATATYRGSSRPGRTKNWDRSTLIFMCPDQGGNLQISNGSETRQVYVEPSSQLHALTLMGNTSQFTVTNVDIPHLEAVGVWLESSSGVTVDNMSLRGNSGVSHRRLSRAVTQQLADEGGVDYDLVIVEYGTNAVSAGQTNYDGYGRLMADVIGKIKASYPNADILMMAIGDRGQRVGSEVRSLQAVGPMIDVQRATARRSGVAFWDTREAMGGVDAVVDWNRQGFINADFVHLSHRGGARLAPMLVHAIILNTPLPER